jgi:hypothetical protein
MGAAQLVCDNAQNAVCVRWCGGIAPLMGLLAPGGPAAVHEQAAGALWSVWRCGACGALTNTANKASIRQGRGEAGVVGLLAPACPAAVHRMAAGALASLTSESGLCWEAVGACGAAAALQYVLACASSALAHVRAAAALRKLGHA